MSEGESHLRYSNPGPLRKHQWCISDGNVTHTHEGVGPGVATQCLAKTGQDLDIEAISDSISVCIIWYSPISMLETLKMCPWQCGGRGGRR